MTWLLIVSAAVNVVATVVMLYQLKLINEMADKLQTHPIQVTKTINGDRVTYDAVYDVAPRRASRNRYVTTVPLPHGWPSAK